ncbi:MAG: hypothetical protein NC084_12055 [Bacteroides sp.]|nr:hypothetical protein [Eubacterium sp.]MCM1419286.1 hypothetical protein [Roseburia sp.]MCM1463426.1 hypothetical protein [Bacteroides sp.]
MTAKEYLSRYREIVREIKEKTEEIEYLEAIAEKVAPSSTRGGGGVISDKVGRGAARLIDLRCELDDRIVRLMTMRQEIEAAIARSGDARDRLILRKRYIAGETWEEIAKELEITTVHVWRLHKRALEAAEKVIKHD